MTDCSKIEPPFSRTRSTCSFDDTNCKAYGVTLDSGTRDMGALQFEHRTLWSNSRNTIDEESRLDLMRTTPSHQVPPST